MAICISIELYEIVQLRSGDGVALPLTLSLTVGAVGLTLRGGGGGGGGAAYQVKFVLKKEPIKKKIIWPNNLLSGLSAN